MQPFAPKQGGNVNVSVTTTSQAVTIGMGQKQLRILNKGAGDVYVYHYSSSSLASANVRAATTSDYRVASGQSSIITKAQGHDTVAIIGDAAATVSLCPGDGW
jgi:hypothetical protein